MKTAEFMKENKIVDSFVEFTSKAPKRLKRKRIEMRSESAPAAPKFNWTIDTVSATLSESGAGDSTFNSMIRAGKARSYDLKRFFRIVDVTSDKRFMSRSGAPDFYAISRLAASHGVKVSPQALSRNYRNRDDYRNKPWNIDVREYKVSGSRNKTEIINF